ncbi:serine/threonine-protein kinase [Peterkaempfera sp. SMS 1(5)a]|uniref:serine/threonine-protein kinase n=1 Tax=Peterkaempfera podocarpi TaxID=3232308 RepID=UPI00366EA96C
MGTFTALSAGDPARIGRYQLVARLGAGGMGRVFLARSPGGRLLAVKVIRPELAEDPEFRRRFAREVAAARSVTGLFTAAVIDADTDASPPWLATAYIPGTDLGTALTSHGPWPEEAVARLGAGLAEALEAIHDVGVIHRDLKPANVLLSSDGPRVIDFGISVATEHTALTSTGVTIGTPGYMSPEQITGDPVGPATDVFSLGAVLAYTATGHAPFGSGSGHALSYRVVHEHPNLDAVPQQLRTTLARCLDKNPANRPSLPDLLQELTSGVQDSTVRLRQADWFPARVTQTVLDQAQLPELQLPPTRQDLSARQDPQARQDPPTEPPADATPHAEPTAAPTPAPQPGPGPAAGKRKPRRVVVVASGAAVIAAGAAAWVLWLTAPTISTAQLVTACTDMYSDGELTHKQCEQIADCYEPHLHGVSNEQFKAVVDYNLRGSGSKPAKYDEVEAARQKCAQALSSISAYVDGTAGDT